MGNHYLKPHFNRYALQLFIKTEMTSFVEQRGLVSRPGESHPEPLAGRVENWRAHSYVPSKTKASLYDEHRNSRCDAASGRIFVRDGRA